MAFLNRFCVFIRFRKSAWVFWKFQSRFRAILGSALSPRDFLRRHSHPLSVWNWSECPHPLNLPWVQSCDLLTQTSARRRNEVCEQLYTIHMKQCDWNSWLLCFICETKYIYNIEAQRPWMAIYQDEEMDEDYQTHTKSRANTSILCLSIVFFLLESYVRFVN